jgi:hypothetical protein
MLFPFGFRDRVPPPSFARRSGRVERERRSLHLLSWTWRSGGRSPESARAVQRTPESSALLYGSVGSLYKEGVRQEVPGDSPGLRVSRTQLEARSRNRNTRLPTLRSNNEHGRRRSAERGSCQAAER